MYLGEPARAEHGDLDAIGDGVRRPYTLRVANLTDSVGNVACVTAASMGRVSSALAEVIHETMNINNLRMTSQLP